MPIIVIEGNIGAGKSSLINAVKDCKLLRDKYDSLEFFYEPMSMFTSFQKYNPLELFYINPKQNAVTFQFYVILKYIDYMKDILNTVGNHNTLYIFERSVLSCSVFVNTLFYENLIDSFTRDFMLSYIKEKSDFLHIDSIYYLDVQPTECYSRMKIRGRKEELMCSYEHLETVHLFYQEFISNLKALNIPVIYSPSNYDIKSLSDHFTQFLLTDLK